MNLEPLPKVASRHIFSLPDQLNIASSRVVWAAAEILAAGTGWQKKWKPVGSGYLCFEVVSDNVDLGFFHKAKNGFGAENEPKIRRDFPFDPALSSSYVRLSILMNRSGACGDTLFQYKRAIYEFVPIPVKGS